MEITDLQNKLKKQINGDIHFDQLTRLLYATDASDFRKLPAGVIMPKHVDEIAATMEIGADYGMSVIPRGGGSSVSGQTVGPGIVIDHTKYLNRLLEVNSEEQWVWVEAGMSLDSLNAALQPLGMMVGPDPSSSAVATIGGMTGNNSTGSHSIKYKQIADHILEMEVILSNGEIATFSHKTAEEIKAKATVDSLEGHLYKEIPKILNAYQDEIDQGYPTHWRNVAGYALNRLRQQSKLGNGFNLAPFIAGSEGTLASISKVKLGIVPRPPKTTLMILPFNNLPSAIEVVPFILEHPVSAIELMTYPTLKLAHDHPLYGPRLKRFVNGLPGSILIVEFAGNKDAELKSLGVNLEGTLRKHKYTEEITYRESAEEINQVWSIRKAVKGLQDSQPGATKRINVIDDPAVPVEELAKFTSEVTEVGKQYGVDLNFDAHASVGCLHLSPAINLRTTEGVRTMELMAKEIITIAIAHHGTTTGEHGEGLARSYFNEQLYGERLHQAFHETKRLFDPENRLNPYKILNTIEPWDESWLKYHSGYRVDQGPDQTYFDYRPHADYAGLIEMCNGQGTCRSQVAGTMCPSFRVTGNEKDSPRGRANILREALTGHLGDKGWLSQEVYDVLDLCLECKACKRECSSGLDVAKLKYEFLTHYQKARGTSTRGRLFASLGTLNRLGRISPPFVNWIYRQTFFRKSLERMVKIDHRRELPKLAKKTFRSWFNHHTKPKDAPNGPVILWDDCHIRDNQPELGMAAVSILEQLGFEVHLLDKKKCCGRPLISKGFLDKAKQNAQFNIDHLSSWAKKGVPIVGVEPSCVACFRDEYPELISGDLVKQVASQTFFFEEFINHLVDENRVTLSFTPDHQLNIIQAHTHCYQKALDQSDQVIRFLSLIPNAAVEEIGDGCCGMAGSFGYEKEHYDLSMTIGEKNLFHYIRSAPDNTTFAAAGTSCRQQIKDGTSQRARHPLMIFAEVLKMEKT